MKITAIGPGKMDKTRKVIFYEGIPGNLEQMLFDTFLYSFIVSKGGTFKELALASAVLELCNIFGQMFSIRLFRLVGNLKNAVIASIFMRIVVFFLFFKVFFSYSFEMLLFSISLVGLSRGIVSVAWFPWVNEFIKGDSNFFGFRNLVSGISGLFVASVFGKALDLIGNSFYLFIFSTLIALRIVSLRFLFLTPKDKEASLVSPNSELSVGKVMVISSLQAGVALLNSQYAYIFLNKLQFSNTLYSLIVVSNTVVSWLSGPLAAKMISIFGFTVIFLLSNAIMLLSVVALFLGSAVLSVLFVGILRGFAIACLDLGSSLYVVKKYSQKEWVHAIRYYRIFSSFAKSLSSYIGGIIVINFSSFLFSLLMLHAVFMFLTSRKLK